MTKGLIKRGKGKHGKYYPATKAYRGTTITADVFSKSAAGLILANEDFSVDSPFFQINRKWQRTSICVIYVL
jgi:hypothetical protein